MESTAQSVPAGRGGRTRNSLLMAVVGNPNSGKTTLFNALTGLRQRVANYAGVTVDLREAAMLGDESVRLVDLPGLYSLSAASPDEALTSRVLLRQGPDLPRPDAVLLVVDASNLERNLFAATQVLELGLPAIVVCNMVDVLANEGVRLDPDGLARALGVPVVTTVASQGEGISEVLAAIRDLNAKHRVGSPGRRWRLPETQERAVARVSESLRNSGQFDERSAAGIALLLLDQAPAAQNTSLPPAVREALTAARQEFAGQRVDSISVALARGRYQWLHEVTQSCMVRTGPVRPSRSDAVDRVLTHPLWGNVCFALVMATMFYSVFALAGPLMDLIQHAVRAGQEWIVAVMPAGVLRELLRNGVLAGLGAVMSFFPQIALLFVFIEILEDSGYMARAAMVMNRLMSRVGLHGKSFIPLLSSFACTVPGVLAARTIDNPRDRLATILIAPFMSCSARLPIYTLLIAACLPIGSMAKAAIMFGLYALGIVAAMTAAAIFKRTILRSESHGFIIELPPYHVPRLRTLVLVVWTRCREFLVKTGTVILAVTIVLWAMTSFPRDPAVVAKYDALRATQTDGGSPVAAEHGPPAAVRAKTSRTQIERLNRQEQAEILRHSVAGRIGRLMEPALRPLGFNWEIGVGLLSSFAARELFVGTMGIIYSVGEADDHSATLQDQMRSATWPDGRQVFTPLVAIGLMVFYVLSCQCVSTIAVVHQETRSWRWPAFQIAYMTTVAYLAALLVYQMGTALGK